MISQNNTLDPNEIAKFSKLAPEWWDTQGSLKTLHDINPPRLEFIRQFSGVADLRILDVGCGGGILSEAMAKLGANVTGLDAEIESILVARTHAIESNVSIQYVCTLIEEYEETPFDIITCMEMLEHVSQPQEVIQHCARLLRPGGLLFLSTLNRTVQAYFSAIIGAEYVLQILPKQTHDYNKFIKPSELAHMARQSQLQLLGIKGLTYNPFTRKASLQKEVAVNYLMVYRKPK